MRKWSGVVALLLVTLVAGACGGGSSDQSKSSTTTTALSTTTTAANAVDAVDASIKVYADCKTTSVEPSEIILACADLGARFERLNWTRWTSSSASATGDFVYNDCKPDCASGQSQTLATTVTLTSPVRDPNGQMVWSLLQSSPKPPGYDPEPDELPTKPA